MIYIYKHRNTINGKVYIGQTNNIKNRWKANSYKDSPRFYNAIQKYGWDNFTHEILSEIEEPNEADNQEIALIEYFDATNPEKGYNILPGGGINRRGMKITEEHKEKISSFHKGKIITDTTRKKISNTRKGIIFSDEHRKNLSISSTGKILSNTTKEKMSKSKIGKNHPFYGKHHSDESKKKMSKNSGVSKGVYLIDTIDGWDEYYPSVKELNRNYPEWNYTVLLQKIRNNNLYKKRYKLEYEEI